MIMYTKQVNNSKSEGRVDIDTRVDIDAHPMNIGGHHILPQILWYSYVQWNLENKENLGIL